MPRSCEFRNDPIGSADRKAAKRRTPGGPRSGKSALGDGRPRREKTSRAAEPVEAVTDGTAEEEEKEKDDVAAKMLAVLADPKLLGSTTSQKIRKSGISKELWYRHRSDAGVLFKMARACHDALDEYTGPVL